MDQDKGPCFSQDDFVVLKDGGGVGGIDGHTFAWIFRVVVRELGGRGGTLLLLLYFIF